MCLQCGKPRRHPWVGSEVKVQMDASFPKASAWRKTDFALVLRMQRCRPPRATPRSGWAGFKHHALESCFKELECVA